MENKKTAVVSAAIENESISSQSALQSIQASSRYFFDASEFARLTGREPQSVALKMALHRLSVQGRITCVARRPARWLIIPAEHQHYGAPPIDWWIDALFSETEPAYYVALLSAARHWGSSHYALQETQVMLPKPRPSLSVGRQRIAFFSKSNGKRTPVELFIKGNSRFRVSTREATLLDLVRHQDKIGGLDAISRITKDFMTEISSRRLFEALDAQDQVPCAQRMGFVFDNLSMTKYAGVVETWLDGKSKKLQPLTPSEHNESEDSCINQRWQISYVPQQLRTLQEAV